MDVVDKTNGWLVPTEGKITKHKVTKELIDVLSTLEQYADLKGNKIENIKMNLYSFVKALNECGLNKFKNNVEASVWARHQDVKRKIPIVYVATTLIEEIAADHIWWKRGCVGPVPDKEEPEVMGIANLIWKKLANKPRKIEAVEEGIPDVFNRLTDEERYPFHLKLKRALSPRLARRRSQTVPHSPHPPTPAVGSASPPPILKLRRKAWMPWRTHPLPLM